MSTLTGENELWAPVRRLRLGARRVGTAAWWRRWTFVGVMSVFVAMILASYAVPLWYQLHGDRLLVVTSGSMAPEIQAGDAVVIRQVTSASQLRVGQVITFYPPKSATLVTHRIVGVAYVARVDRDGNGVLDDQGKPLTDPYVKTKGDANRIDDPNLKSQSITPRRALAELNRIRIHHLTAGDRDISVTTRRNALQSAICTALDVDTRTWDNATIT